MGCAGFTAGFVSSGAAALPPLPPFAPFAPFAPGAGRGPSGGLGPRWAVFGVGGFWDWPLDAASFFEGGGMWSKIAGWLPGQVGTNALVLG